MIPHFLPPFCHSFSMYQPPWPWALHCAPESPKNQTHMHPYTQELTQLSQEADIKRSDNCPYESYRGPVGVWPDLENQSSELEDIYSLVGGWAKHGWNSALGRGNIMITGQVVGGCRGRAGHILGSEGRLGWLECVCSTDPFVPVCSPCGCFSRVMVCSSLPQLGFAPSFPATEAFSMCWSAITTQATTSTSESGALTRRLSRCRVSAGSSSEQGDRRGAQEQGGACLEGGAAEGLPCPLLCLRPVAPVSQFIHSQHESNKRGLVLAVHFDFIKSLKELIFPLCRFAPSFLWVLLCSVLLVTISLLLFTLVYFILSFSCL